MTKIRLTAILNSITGSGSMRPIWLALLVAPLVSFSIYFAFDEPMWILPPVVVLVMIACIMIQNVGSFVLNLFPLLCFHHIIRVNVLFSFFCVVVLLIERQVDPKSNHHFSWRDYGLISIALLSAFSIFRVENRLATFVWWSYDYLPLISFTLLVNRYFSQDSIRHAIRLFLIVALLASLTVILDGIMHPKIRAIGLVDSYPTGVAFDLVMFFPIALGMYVSNKEDKIWLITAIIVLMAIFFTGTRMPFFIAIMCAFPFFKLNQLRLPLLVLIAVYVAIQSGGGLVSRYDAIQAEGGVSGAADASTVVRLIQWALALNILRLHGWFGIGFGHYHEVARTMFPDPTMILGHPHNVVLEKMVQVGIPLALLYFLFIGSIFWQNWRAYRHLRLSAPSSEHHVLLGLGLGATAMLACGVSDAVLTGPNQPILFWMIMAVWTLYTKMLCIDPDSGLRP